MVCCKLCFYMGALSTLFMCRFQVSQMHIDGIYVYLFQFPCIQFHMFLVSIQFQFDRNVPRSAFYSFILKTTNVLVEKPSVFLSFFVQGNIFITIKDYVNFSQVPLRQLLTWKSNNPLFNLNFLFLLWLVLSKKDQSSAWISKINCLLLFEIKEWICIWRIHWGTNLKSLALLALATE